MAPEKQQVSTSGFYCVTVSSGNNAGPRQLYWTILKLLMQLHLNNNNSHYVVNKTKMTRKVTWY